MSTLLEGLALLICAAFLLSDRHFFVAGWLTLYTLWTCGMHLRAQWCLDEAGMTVDEVLAPLEERLNKRG